MTLHVKAYQVLSFEQSKTKFKQNVNVVLSPLLANWQKHCSQLSLI